MSNTIHIMIDGSYFVFYRFFALTQWWGLAKKDLPQENIHLIDEAVEKFKTQFYQTINELPKKLKLHKLYHNHSKIKYYIGKDCPREQIWRNKYIENYKGNRDNYSNSKNNPGEFFKIVYNQQLFEKAFEKINKKCLYFDYNNMNSEINNSNINSNVDNNIDSNINTNSINNNETVLFLEFPQLEADDCIALYSKHILETKPHDEIIIITSDMDYMQLIQPNLSLYNLKYKNVNNEKNSMGCSKQDLLCKIIMGDKSDNIPSIFPKCGIKTAQKYVYNISKFQKKLEENPEYKARYDINKKIIDFNMIPEDLKNNFYIKYKIC